MERKEQGRKRNREGGREQEIGGAAATPDL